MAVLFCLQSRLHRGKEQPIDRTMGCAVCGDAMILGHRAGFCLVGVPPSVGGKKGGKRECTDSKAALGPGLGGMMSPCKLVPFPPSFLLSTMFLLPLYTIAIVMEICEFRIRKGGEKKREEEIKKCTAEN